MRKVLFITKPFLIEQLGIGALSAQLKAYKYKVDLLQVSNKEKAIKEVMQINPDYLCYSVWTGGHNFFFDINREIKKAMRRKPISIFGGVHCTFSKDGINQDGVDYVIRGEADYELPALLLKIDNGIPIENKEIYSSLPPQSLDELPLVDRKILYKYKHNKENPIRSVMSSRGCPYSCPFCYNEKYGEMFEGKKLRFRDIENVVEEAYKIKIEFPETRYFFFQDDELGSRTRRLEDLNYWWNKKKVSLPFHAQMRVEYINSQSIKLLKNTGCNSITFSIESGNYETRKGLLNKKFTNEQILKAVSILNRYKMKFRVENMIGIPFTKNVLEDMWETYEMNKKLSSTMAWVSLFQPYPGTSLGDRSIKEKLYSGNVDEIPSAFFDKTILKYSKNEVIQLENMQKLFSLFVKFKVNRVIVSRIIQSKFLSQVYSSIGTFYKKKVYRRLYGL